jgi:hypothetical protein
MAPAQARCEIVREAATAGEVAVGNGRRRGRIFWLQLALSGRA